MSGGRRFRAIGCLPLVPLRAEVFRREVAVVLDGYNEHRPHTTLGGKTPNEVYFGRFPANRKPRFEPRARWPRGSPSSPLHIRPHKTYWMSTPPSQVKRT